MKTDKHIAEILERYKDRWQEMRKAIAAYRRGRADFKAGRSIHASPFAEKTLDAAWHRGQTDAMREQQKALRSR